MALKDRFKEHLHVASRGGIYERCPVRCGMCCSDGEYYTCSKLGVAGCTLEKKDRPVVCNEYLCNAAKRVLRLEAEIATERYLQKEHRKISESCIEQNKKGKTNGP